MNVLNNRINSLLAEAGFSKSETTVYLAGSAKGMSSSMLLNATNIPKPTLMAALKTLRDCGLCDTYKRDGRSLYYVMLPLVSLKPYLGKRMRHIDGLLEELDSLDVSKAPLSSLTEATGQEEVVSLIDKALRCKITSWLIIAPRENLFGHMTAEYKNYVLNIRTKRQIQSKTLWQHGTSEKPAAIRDLVDRKSRYLPQSSSMGLSSLIIAYDNCLLVVSGTTTPSATLVQDANLTETFRIMFDIAWDTARGES